MLLKWLEFGILLAVGLGAGFIIGKARSSQTDRQTADRTLRGRIYYWLGHITQLDVMLLLLQGALVVCVWLTIGFLVVLIVKNGW